MVITTDLEVCQTAGPPATLEDLTKFLLIAPEKATAMRAEIRAIKKAGLAAEVYRQKVEEQRRLCDMILDASVLLGDMAKEIRKASGGDRRSENFKSNGTVTFEDKAAPQISKAQAIQELGFSKQQMHNFETLAANKDLVELEKAQAREEGRMPTRTKVLDMAQERKKRFDRDMAQIDEDSKIHKKFLDAIYIPQELPDSSVVVSAIMGATEGRPDNDLDNLGLAIQKLQEIQILLRKEAHQHGKKSDH